MVFYKQKEFTLLIDLSINLLASVIFFIIGYTLTTTRRYIKNKDYYKFFNTIINSKCSVFLSTRQGPNPESTLRVSFSEMIAYSKINEKLSELGIKTEALDSLSDINQIDSENIFVLGGHFANTITKKYWEQINNKLPLKLIPQKRQIIIGERIYEPQIKDNGVYITTYSLIMRINNPIKQNGYIFSSLGLNGFGTLAGTLAMLDRKSIKKINTKVNNNNFVALVEAKVENKKVYCYEIIEIYPLYDM